MNAVQAARKVLRDAEASLRELIEKALAEQQYGEIGAVAHLADGLTKLIRSNSIAADPAPLSTRNTQTSPRKESRGQRKAKSASTKEKYPFFKCDGNRLVKVGWSKKNKKEYEHRVPRDVVIAFVRHLGDNVEEGKVFDVEGLLPVADPSGEEVPPYQIYVTLAWLRRVAIIEKKGRDGYVMRDKSIVTGGLDDLWNGLEIRSV